MARGREVYRRALEGARTDCACRVAGLAGEERVDTPLQLSILACMTAPLYCVRDALPTGHLIQGSSPRA